MDFRSLADDAIGLFLEYRDRHGQSEDDARISACLEVIEGTDNFEIVSRATESKGVEQKPSKKCYEVDDRHGCPAIWHDQCTSNRYDDCGVKEAGE